MSRKQGQDHNSGSVSKPASRRAVLSSLGAAGIAGLAGCSGSGGSGGGQEGTTVGESGDGKVTVDFWMYFGGEEGSEIRSLIKEFENKHPKININEQSVPFSSFLDKLYTAVSGGKAPHLASYYLSYTRYMQQLCDPIDEYAPDGIVDQYFPITQRNMQLNGKTYALPLDIHSQMLVTNDDVLEKNGVEAPQSWEDLKKACQTLQDGGVSRPFSAIPGPYPQNLFRSYYLMLLQANGSAVKKQGDKFDVIFNETDVGKQTAKTMMSVTGERGWDNPTVGDQSARTSAFINDNLPMMINGNWVVNSFENDNEEIVDGLNFTFHKPYIFPGAKENKRAWAESNSLYFPKNPNHTDKEKQAAVKFANWVTNNHPVWATTAGHLPASKEVAKMDTVRNSPYWKDYKIVETLWEMASNDEIRYQPRTPINWNAVRFWQPMVDAYGQKISALKGLNKSADKLTQALKNA